MEAIGIVSQVVANGAVKFLAKIYQKNNILKNLWANTYENLRKSPNPYL